MLYSTTVFLYLFLPIVLGIYFVTPGHRLKNLVLLLASLFFYAWGEGPLVLTLLGSILMNYLFGLAIHRARGSGGADGMLAAAVAANLALLAAFKYADFLVAQLNAVRAMAGAAPLHVAPVHLPVGLSFFTFQALSYVIDLHRGRARLQRDPLTLGLYIALFPQLILGPIVRYREIASQLAGRVVSLEGFAEGVSRFIVGLGKKVLIADTLAPHVAAVFALPTDSLTPGLAWLAVGGFSLQLYFDFSGYADMAIGLGRMFGFRFRENFRYPYAARSRSEYYRRWHISFFTWLRDYLYRPLCGRKAGEFRRTANILVVMLAAGLWHGAGWNFIGWGLYNGTVIAAERVWLGEKVRALPRALQHAYAIALMLISNAVFRAPTLRQGFLLLAAMGGFAAASGGPVLGAAAHLDAQVLLAIGCGIAGSLPLVPRLSAAMQEALRHAPAPSQPALRAAFDLGEVALLALMLGASLLVISSGTYTPFFYFQF